MAVIIQSHTETNGNTVKTWVTVFAAFCGGDITRPPMPRLFNESHPFRPPPVPRTFVSVDTDDTPQCVRETLRDHSRQVRAPPI